MDAYGLALDGEPRAGGSGQSYIYSAALDLPTGDGTPGGDAVFYVGSLRGDYCGPNGAGSPPDGELTSNDVTEFHQKYAAGSLDADFRAASGTGGPDDRVTSSDVLGFKYVYTHPGHIGPLPSVAGGGTVGLAPLIGADGSVSAMAMRADTPEAPILPGDAAAPAPTAATSGTTDALSVAAPVLYVSASGGTGGDSAAGVSSSASAALVPGAPTAPSVPSGADLDPDGGLVDALASAQPAAAMAV